MDTVDEHVSQLPHCILADWLEEHPHYLHDEATPDHLRSGKPVLVARHPVTGKVAAWPGEGLVHRIGASVNQLRPRFLAIPFRHVFHGPQGLVTVHMGHGGVLQVTARNPRDASPIPSTSGHTSPHEARDAAIHRAWGDPVKLARTTEPITDTPKTPKELRARKVPHTVGAKGKPVVAQADLVAALNARNLKKVANVNIGRHLLHAGAHDVAAGTSDTAMRDWYGPHAREMEHGFHRLLGYPDSRDHPSQVFAKVLVGLTSPSTTPNVNVDTTARMLQSAHGDIRHVPLDNTPALAQFLGRHQGTVPSDSAGPFAPDLYEHIDKVGPHGAGAWAHRHGFRTDKDVAYYGLGGRFDGSRVTHLNKGGTWIPVGEDGPMGKHAVHVPLLSDDGELMPKAWKINADSLRIGLAGLHRLIREQGPEAAAAFLTQEHPVAKVQAARRAYVSRHGKVKDTGLPDGDPVAGFLMFGPKIGSFMANMHDSERLGKYLTADMWFARWFRRHQGILKGDKEPITPPERKEMYAFAQKLMRHTGAESIAQLQAVLWGAEQKLWRSYHQKAPSGNLLDATIRVLDKNKIPHKPGTTRA